jgi:hypothetical protein
MYIHTNINRTFRVPPVIIMTDSVPRVAAIRVAEGVVPCIHARVNAGHDHALATGDCPCFIRANAFDVPLNVVLVGGNGVSACLLFRVKDDRCHGCDDFVAANRRHVCAGLNGLHERQGCVPNEDGVLNPEWFVVNLLLLEKGADVGLCHVAV